MNNKFKKVFKIVVSIVFVAIPSFLTYLGTSNSCLDRWKKYGWLGNKIDVSDLKDKLLLLSIIITGIFGSVVLIYNTIKKEESMEQRNEILRLYHKSFISSLKKSIKKLPQPLNFRIFIPQYKTYYLKRFFSFITFNKFKPSLQLKIKNILMFSDEGNTKGLLLDVFPNNQGQGVVGKSFILKEPQIENDAQINKDIYNLNLHQQYKTQTEKFIVSIPLFNSKHTDRIVAIVSLDSPQQGNIVKGSNEERILFYETTVYCNTLQTFVPELFK